MSASRHFGHLNVTLPVVLEMLFPSVELVMSITWSDYGLMEQQGL
jgi:hypothetical protein